MTETNEAAILTRRQFLMVVLFASTIGYIVAFGTMKLIEHGRGECVCRRVCTSNSGVNLCVVHHTDSIGESP